MDAVEFRLPKEIDNSFIVFREKGQYFPCPWHYHPEYEIVLVTKSTGRRMVGDHIGYFDEGDLVFIGSWLPHLWLNEEEYFNESSTKEADAIVIHFKDKFLGQEFFDSPEMSDFKKFLVQSERGMVLFGTARKEIAKIMLKMPNSTGLKRLSLLLEVFHILGKTNEYELLTSPHFYKNFHFESSDRFEKVTEHILKSYTKDIKLQDIANIANMSVTAFSTFFKQQFRMTFTEYINEIRIGHSCKLLSKKNLNIMEVAYQSGFNNLANYNRQFKKIKKMTPSEYRKKIIL